MQEATATREPTMTFRSVGNNKSEKKYETIIRGKIITASFSTEPDENILGLVKKLLIDSHASNFTENKNL